MSFQENKKLRNINCLPKGGHFTLHAFHPKAWMIKLYLAGLLAYSVIYCLPVVHWQWR